MTHTLFLIFVVCATQSVTSPTDLGTCAMGDREFEIVIPGIKHPIPLDACDICDTWYSLNLVSIVTCTQCAKAQTVCKKCTHCANENGEFMCVMCMLEQFGEER